MSTRLTIVNDFRYDDLLSCPAFAAQCDNLDFVFHISKQALQKLSGVFPTNSSDALDECRRHRDRIFSVAAEILESGKRIIEAADIRRSSAAMPIGN